MSRSPKIYTIFCIAAMALVLVSSHVYSDYDALREADFLGHGLKFEAGDFENIVVDKPKLLNLIPHSLFIEFVSEPDAAIAPAAENFSFNRSDRNSAPLRC
ncbi:MAG TPA: hypothetical protein VLS90_05060 [Thermodesulfobacteriota bacterium]|nr:hypothetical protein [Thermodesulfobacteriota bacterium]